MTKLETIELLLEQKDEIIDRFAETWTDEYLLKNWNYRDRIDQKGLKLVKKDDEFVIEFYSPIEPFLAELWQNKLY